MEVLINLADVMVVEFMVQNLVEEMMVAGIGEAHYYFGFGRGYSDEQCTFYSSF